MKYPPLYVCTEPTHSRYMQHCHVIKWYGKDHLAVEWHTDGRRGYVGASECRRIDDLPQGKGRTRVEQRKQLQELKSAPESINWMVWCFEHRGKLKSARHEEVCGLCLGYTRCLERVTA